MSITIKDALPKPGEDLCTAWERLEKSRIQSYAAQSIAEAKEILHDLVSAGFAPSANKPAIFYINGNQYIVYDANAGFAPVNEIERKVDNWHGAQQDFTVGKGNSKTLITTTLPAKNYDRMAIVTANAWGKATSGSNVALGLAGQNGHVDYVSKFEAGSSGEGVSVSGIFRIPAGQAPQIKAVIYGTWGTGGTVNITDNVLQNSMTVLATPVSMVN